MFITCVIYILKRSCHLRMLINPPSKKFYYQENCASGVYVGGWI